VTAGAIVISVLSIAFLFWWDANKPKTGFFKLMPAPLVVVAGAVAINALFGSIAPGLQLQQEHLVEVPVAGNATEFLALFSLPDFGQIGNSTVWTVAITLAIVASLESLLSVTAVDELDPQRRTTDKNRELFAQGGGNLVSGLIGGLPVTSVIVRSSANVDSGASSKLSAILHGIWLLGSVVLIPTIINLIPLAALAAVLIQTGYKLTKPALFVKRWKQGYTQFVPFVATIVAILFTDLLIGIVIGLMIGFVFVIARNFRPAVTLVCDPDGRSCMIRARRNLYFIHKLELQKALGRVPNGAELLIDLSATNYVDLDNIDIINAFVRASQYRDITVSVRGDIAEKSAPLVNAPRRELVHL
jgi:MFS superfamily sulfate permease-like transporter